MPLINSQPPFVTMIKASYFAFISALSNIPVTRLRRYVITLTLQIIILSFIFCSETQLGFGEYNLTKSTLKYDFEFKEKIYRIPYTDAQVTLPSGWKGINLSSFILITPEGIDTKTGENKAQIPVYMTVGYFSLQPELKTYHVTTLEEYAQNMAKATKCPISDNGTVRVNGFNGYKIRINCEFNKLERDNIINYFFISDNKVIFIGLKGINPSFYRYLGNLDETVKSLGKADLRIK